MADEATSFVDEMAAGDPLDVGAASADSGGPPPAGEGEGAGGGDASPAATPKPDDELKGRLDRIEQQLFEQTQQAAYWRGQAERNRRDDAPATPAKPEPYQVNEEQFNAALEKAPAKAIIELIQNLVNTNNQIARHEIEESVTGKVTLTQRQQELKNTLEREHAEVMGRYSDLLGKDASGRPHNKAFDDAVGEYLQGLAVAAGTPGRFTPGQMRAAADAVYGQWARDGKLPAKKPAAEATTGKSLLEMIRSVPRSDNLSNGSGARNGSAKSGVSTLEDLQRVGYFKSDREMVAARNYAKKMGWAEPDYVENIKEIIKNGEVDNGDR